MYISVPPTAFGASWLIMYSSWVTEAVLYLFILGYYLFISNVLLFCSIPSTCAYRAFIPPRKRVYLVPKINCIPFDQRTYFCTKCVLITSSKYTHLYSTGDLVSVLHYCCTVYAINSFSLVVLRVSHIYIYMCLVLFCTASVCKMHIAVPSNK
jgi:hypothetical protein